jgi:hypothetical protein
VARHRQIASRASLSKLLDPSSLDYWLAYWIDAFEYLSNKNGLSFLSYENLCNAPKQGVEKLFQHLGINFNESTLLSSASVFKGAPAARKKNITVDLALVKRANELHERLLSDCLLNN